MISKTANIVIILLLCNAVYALEEITKVTFTLVQSNILATTINGMSGIKTKYSFCEENEIQRAINIKEVTHFEGTMYEGIENDPRRLMLGGYFIIELDKNENDRYVNEVTMFKPVSKSIDAYGIACKVMDSDVDEFVSNINSKIPFAYTGRGIDPNSVEKTYQISYPDESKLNPPVVKIRGYQILDPERNETYNQRSRKYSDLFRQKNIPIEKIICINDGAGKRLAAVVKYGIMTRHYAMYGIWNTENAEQFGYQNGDRIYMSEGVRLNNCSFASKYRIGYENDATYKRQYPQSYFGEKVWSYEYIINNKEETYPQLAWRPYPLNSSTAVRKDEEGHVLPDDNGYIPPNAPDSRNNTNPPGLQDCPDMDWYWELFCECASKRFKEDNFEVSASQYQSYKDYLAVKTMAEKYDPTIYGADGSINPQNISTEEQPVEPYLYTRDLVLINKDFPMMYDPFDESTTFKLQYEYWAKLFDGDDGWGWTTRYRNVKNDVLPAIKKAMSIYPLIKDSVNLKENLRKLKAEIKSVYDIGFTYELKDEYLDKPLYVSNLADKSTPYRDARTFVIQDYNYFKNGKPFKVVSYDKKLLDGKKWYEGWVNYQATPKEWYMVFEWRIMYKDKFGIKHDAGKIDWKIHFKSERDLLWPSGKEIKGTKRNEFLYLGGDQIPTEQMAGYDSISKDYYTDQYDASDRDSDIEKNEALQELILKIAVSEGLDLVMKGIHYLGTKKKYLAPVYEGAKRLENSFTQSKTYEMAKQVYKAYVFWKQTMDLAAELRDQYNSISKAWDGLLYSITSIYDYYKDLDYSKVNLRNITMLSPASKIDRIDVSLYSLQLALGNTSAAIYGCAFQADRIINPTVRAATQVLQNSMHTSNEQTTDVINRNSNEINELQRKSSRGASDQNYLSNIAGAVHSAIVTQDLKVNNEKIRSLSIALFCIEAESKDWLTYQQYWQKTTDASNFEEARNKAKNQNSLAPIWIHTQPPTGLFTQARIVNLEELR